MASSELGGLRFKVSREACQKSLIFLFIIIVEIL